MKTKTAKQFLALGIAMITTGLSSEKLFQLVLKSDFPKEYWFFNGLLITIGIVFFYSGVRNLWVREI